MNWSWKDYERLYGPRPGHLKTEPPAPGPEEAQPFPADFTPLKACACTENRVVDTLTLGRHVIVTYRCACPAERTWTVRRDRETGAPDKPQEVAWERAERRVRDGAQSVTLPAALAELFDVLWRLRPARLGVAELAARLPDGRNREGCSAKTVRVRICYLRAALAPLPRVHLASARRIGYWLEVGR